MAGTVYEPPSTTAMPMDTVVPVVMSAYVVWYSVCSVVMGVLLCMCTCDEPVCRRAVNQVILYIYEHRGVPYPCGRNLYTY